jgi:short-subunit dehydrogenase
MQEGDAGPCIIHISSFRTFQSDANQEGYAASKAGLLGLVQSMAITCEDLGDKDEFDYARRDQGEA